jgi:hypothetical protein
LSEREVEVRPPTPADLPAIDELYRSVKGRGRPESVTRHRFFDTPWGDSHSHIALDGDRCIAVFLVWPVAIRVGDEVVAGAQGTDAATHPDYRNRPRLFFGMVREGKRYLEERGVDLYYTFPNTRSIKILKLVGGTYLGEVGAWGMELRPRRWWLWPGRRPAGEVAATQTRPSEVTGLVEAAFGGETAIRVDKSDTWLDWRYSEATAERYEWLVLRDGGAVTAAALVGERDPDVWGPDFAGLLRIHELFALGEDAGTRLLRHAIEHVRRPGARKLDVLVKDPLLERAVERAGFVLENTRPITAHAVREDLPLDPYDFANWRLISGDMDFF